MILVYVPCGSYDEAKKIAFNLLEEKLIACANITESKSIYWWDGKVCDEDEHIILAKTTETVFEKVRDKILELHSYELPCIIGIKVADVNPGFANWVRCQTDG